MGRIPNREIVQKLKDGKPAGCHHLVELYQEKLVGEGVAVFDLVQEDAEELVSDVLLTVVEKIQSFEFKRSESDFHFWVMAIFRNRVRDFVRHEAITEGLEVRFQESDGDDGEDSTAVGKEVIGEIVRRYQDSLRESEGSADGGSAGEKLRIVSQTLERMEGWERVLLRCRALDVPYEEIAEYTGKPVKQLKVYHGRVKKKFVNLLAQHFPELAQVETQADET